jgi:hypothetical protein
VNFRFFDFYRVIVVLHTRVFLYRIHDSSTLDASEVCSIRYGLLLFDSFCDAPDKQVFDDLATHNFNAVWATQATDRTRKENGIGRENVRVVITTVSLLD